MYTRESCGVISFETNKAHRCPNLDFRRKGEKAMLTLFFIILLFAVFGNVFWFAIKLTWGFSKIFLGLIFLPLILIIIAIIGFIYLSIFFLIFGGIIMLLARALRS